jgi:hypothetical protein
MRRFKVVLLLATSTIFVGVVVGLLSSLVGATQREARAIGAIKAIAEFNVEFCRRHHIPVGGYRREVDHFRMTMPWSCPLNEYYATVAKASASGQALRGGQNEERAEKGGAADVGKGEKEGGKGDSHQIQKR